MGKVRVAGFGVSIDGFGAGPDQSLEHPLGKRGTELHGWFIGIMVKQTDLGIQQLHATRERAQDQQRGGRLFVDCRECKQSQRNYARWTVQGQYQRRRVWIQTGRYHDFRTEDRRPTQATPAAEPRKEAEIRWWVDSRRRSSNLRVARSCARAARSV